MKISLIIFPLIASLLLTSCFGSEIGVPVLLWQQKTDSNLFDSKSTVNQIDGKLLAEDYLRDSETIVAFVQKHLSLEQFTAEDEEQITTVKSIFRDQSIKPTLLTDVLNPTQALEEKHFHSQKWDAIHVKNGDKIWIQLPEDSLAQNNVLLSQLMANIERNVSKNVLFLITGHRNQFQSIDLSPEVLEREVRSAPVEDSPIESEISPYLVSISDCLFFYTTFITLTKVGSSQPMYTFNVTESHSGTCWNSTNSTVEHGDSPRIALLDLEYKGENGTELRLHLTIENKGNNYFWGINSNESSIKSKQIEDLKDGMPLKLTTNQVEAEQWFGYSCSKLSLIFQPHNETAKVSYSVTFSNFQLQPFENPHNQANGKHNQIFTDTFDCQVWMTLPLWMGLLTLIIMFIILSVGVYFIAIVNTPDRFENPKAKPLVINAIED